MRGVPRLRTILHWVTHELDSGLFLVVLIGLGGRLSWNSSTQT